jgi:hypothetical protein
MDKLKLEYTLKLHEITKDDLMKENDWSSSTYYRKMSGEAEWLIGEVHSLIRLGVDVTEVIDIFF